MPDFNRLIQWRHLSHECAVITNSKFIFGIKFLLRLSLDKYWFTGLSWNTNFITFEVIIKKLHLATAVCWKCFVFSNSKLLYAKQQRILMALQVGSTSHSIWKIIRRFVSPLNGAVLPHGHSYCVWGKYLSV